MRSRPRYFAALAALAAMLFAQAASALVACDPVRASSRAAMVMQAADEAGCHQPEDNPNLCLAHCQGGEQTLDKHQVKVPEAPFAVIQLFNAWPDAPKLARLSPRLPVPAAGPPPRILFRTLLI